MISNIVQIPKEVLQTRVIPLFKIQDLVYLDSALLNHRLRPQFLDLLKGAHLNTDSVKLVGDAAYWFLKREVYVSSLYVSEVAKDLSILKQLVYFVEARVSFDNCNMLTTEAFKDFIESCGRVKALSFSMCCYGEMEGRVLETIAAFCIALQSIDLSYCRLVRRDQFAALLACSTSLTDLNLNNCKSWVNDECFAIIASNCPQLRTLQANCCIYCADGALLALAKHCRDLHRLSLRTWPSLSDKGVSALIACTELRAFVLSGSTRVTSQSITTLAQHCTKLEEIGMPLCDRQVDVAVAALVQHCPALCVVHSCSQFLTDRSLLSLQNCPLLHTLVLNNVNKISCAALMQLVDHCSALIRLEVSSSSLDCTAAACAGTVAVRTHDSTIESHNRLSSINFSICSSLTHAVLMALTSRCPNITDLNLRMCTGLTDASIISVASHCRNLEVLNISNIPVSNAAVCAIAQSCYFLHSFMAEGCALLTDGAVSALGNHCSNLTHLDMSFCNQLTEAGVIEILQKCRLLRNLDLSCCNHMTKKVLDAAVQYAAHLRRVDLSMCTKIGANAVQAFRSAKPNCELIGRG